MRFTVALAVAFLTMTDLSAASEAQAAIRKPTNIPPQALRPALHLLSKERDFQVVFRTDIVADLKTQGATGDLTVEEALKRILSGTGLTYRYLDDKTITVIPESLPIASGASNSFPRRAEEGAIGPGEGRGTAGLIRLALAQGQEQEVSEQGSENTNIPFDRSSAQKGETLQEVIVTGSRLKRSNLNALIPVSVIDSENLELRGATHIADTLRELPSVGLSAFSSQSDKFGLSTTGLSTINLRNFGESRTLVLVNGRRYVAGLPGTSAVDMNTIPSDLVERVEVITGGASAVYGSDAVAGVVNIILKQDFTGISVKGQHGLSGERDNGKINASLTTGANFADDQGNVVFHFAYAKEKALRSDQRCVNPDGCGGRGIHDTFYDTADAGSLSDPDYSSYTPAGRFNVGSGNWTYDPEGQLVNEYISSRDGFNRSDYRYINIPSDRLLFAGNLHYNFLDNARVYSEAMFSQVESTANLEPFYFWDTLIFTDPDAWGLPVASPLVPDPIRTQAIANGEDFVAFRRRFAENEGRKADNKRNTFRVVLGVDGDITDNWSYDSFFNYGRTTQTQVYSGEMNILNARNAMLVESDPGNPGALRCIDASARALGCVPMNIFGAGSISPDAVAYVRADTNLRATITQEMFSASVNNSHLLALPAGDVGLAMGVEHRRESSETLQDPLVVAGLTGGNKVSSTIGSFDVTEGFIETSLPLIKEAGFAKYLGLEAAFRYADYSTVGNVDSWKFGADWQVVDDIRFRSVYAKSTRAPNIANLFAGAGQVFPSGLIDPCDGIGPGVTPTAGQQACLLDAAIQTRIGNGDTLNQEAFNQLDISGYDLGNPDLEEETGKTLTAGIVLTPTAWPGFSASIDYFNIKVSNAIQVPGRQFILDQCYASASLDNFFCNQITRFTTGENVGHIRFVNEAPGNQGYVKKAGLDVQLDYGLGVAAGTLDLALYYVRMLTSEVQSFDGTVTDQLGDLSTSSDYKNKGSLSATYSLSALTVSWNVNYLGQIYDSLSVHRERAANNLPDYALNDVGAEFFHNMQARYRFDGLSSLEVFGGIDNVFDNKPPFLPTGTASNVWGNDTSPNYSPVGRFFYFGVKTTF